MDNTDKFIREFGKSVFDSLFYKFHSALNKVHGSPYEVKEGEFTFNFSRQKIEGYFLRQDQKVHFELKASLFHVQILNYEIFNTDHSSGSSEEKVCVCKLSYGCKCGAITPYKFKYE